MKTPLLIPLVFLTACAAHPPLKTSTVGTGTVPLNPAILRTPEQLREYRFGRSIDPSDPLAMHESHPVYRVESTAAWNLLPGGGPSPRLTSAATSRANRDAATAEVNRQRIETRALPQQTALLNQRLAEMAQVTIQTQEIAKQNLALQQDLAALHSQVTAIDDELRERSASSIHPAPASSNDPW